MSNSLYTINAEIRDLLDAAEVGDVPEEAFADTLESLTMEFDAKIDDLTSVIKSLTAFCDDIKAEENALAERRKKLERRRDRIKDYVSTALTDAGWDTWESSKHKITFRQSEAVTVDDEAQFLNWAMASREDLLIYARPELSLSAIKKAILSGDTVEGARIEQRANIQIK